MAGSERVPGLYERHAFPFRLVSLRLSTQSETVVAPVLESLSRDLRAL